MTTASATPLARQRRADSDRRHAAVLRALAAMTKAGEDVTVSSVARRAGVHRSLIYRHPDLQAAVEAAVATPPSRTRHPATSPPPRSRRPSRTSANATAG